MNEFDAQKGLIAIIGSMIIALWGWFVAHIRDLSAHGNGTGKVTQAVCDERFKALLTRLEEVREDIKWLRDRLG